MGEWLGGGGATLQPAAGMGPRWSTAPKWGWGGEGETKLLHQPQEKHSHKAPLGNLLYFLKLAGRLTLLNTEKCVHWPHLDADVSFT